MMLLRFITTVALLLIGGCASLPAGYERAESYAVQDTASTTLGRTGSDQRRYR